MKKYLSVILVGLLMVSTTLTGCKKSEDSNENAGTLTPLATPTVEVTAEPTKELTTAFDKECDILIIGAGGAGMTAAIQAVQDGATNVVIIEKNSFVGCNTIRLTGRLNASETLYHAADGVEDHNQLIFDDTMQGC